MNTLCAIAVLLAVATSVSAACTGKAKYQLTFKYQWKSPEVKNIPTFEHFSPLTGISHKPRYSPFSRFGYASPGVKSVAETGATFTFKTELDTAVANNHVLAYQIDPNVRRGTDSASVIIEASCTYSRISAITMIAPSPDWILAVFRLNVVKRGKFISMASGKLRAYDAGTDSGKTFTAANAPSNPRENIAPLDGAFGKAPLATYTLKKM